MRRLALTLLLACLASSVAGSDTAEARKRKAPTASKRSRRRPAPPVPPLTKDGWPNIQAAAAIVIDLDSGEELYARKPDEVRHIASVGKLAAALAVVGKGLPLDGQTAITAEDRKYARGGARTRLLEGKSFTNHDLLRAMLIASDNRAPTALGRAAGLSPRALVKAMNKTVAALGLKKTRFSDPSGLNGNVSTAREMAVILRAALADPVIGPIIGTPAALVRSTSDPKYAVQYFNTNVSLRVGKHKVLGGKTGYTDEARYCLAIGAEINGRRIGMVFLGAEGELTRFADFNRAASWIVAGGPVAKGKMATRGVGASADPPPPPLTDRL